MSGFYGDEEAVFDLDEIILLGKQISYKRIFLFFWKKQFDLVVLYDDFKNTVHYDHESVRDEAFSRLSYQLRYRNIGKND